ncbi:5664_t:CDS:2 [Ambispora gerdemannii]|uniref:5664_t:CDS:1 n=1 Tax=Ambispora gerdemannii TaxID=144530 RepID=A0A9N8VCL2_9GLOM|nr:5664_t:CDS:2 [Ambispora gerdemannii]
MDQTPSKDLISLSTSDGVHIPSPKPTEVVLDEDSYTEAISEIIKRDYFPSLKTLEAQHGYLDALSSRDPTLLRDATRKLSKINTPLRKTPAATPIISRTPQRGEWDTPVSTRTTSTRITSATATTSPEKKYNTNLSLDAFQTKYTSEDNASYP